MEAGIFIIFVYEVSLRPQKVRVGLVHGDMVKAEHQNEEISHLLSIAAWRWKGSPSHNQIQQVM